MPTPEPLVDPSSTTPVPVPLLGRWMLLGLALVLSSVGGFRLRRGSKRS